MKHVFITGVSSGLGEALCELYLRAGAVVYGVSRTKPSFGMNDDNFHFILGDLSEPYLINDIAHELLREVEYLDLVILNAGMLGEIKTLAESSIFEMKEVMDLNMWANKQLLDAIYKLNIFPKQVVAVSSGASLSGHKGWGAYALSKAALNMLMLLFANERPETHFSSIAPGLVRTPMLEHLLSSVDSEAFPSVKRIKESPILHPLEAAQRFYECIEMARNEKPSGIFIDSRNV